MRLIKYITFLILLFSSATTYATIDWNSTLQFTFDTGFENPVVLFGFNPQPEPPPSAIVSQILNPASAEQEISGVQPTPFQLYIATDEGSFSLPPEPIADFNTLEVIYTSPGGSDFTFQFSFSPRADGDASAGISDPLFFNPQPEPPPVFVELFGFQFAFERLQPGDTVKVGLQILDDSQETVQFSALPEIEPVQVPMPKWAFFSLALMIFLFTIIIYRTTANLRR